MIIMSLVARGLGGGLLCRRIRFVVMAKILQSLIGGRVAALKRRGRGAAVTEGGGSRVYAHCCCCQDYDAYECDGEEGARRRHAGSRAV